MRSERSEPFVVRRLTLLGMALSFGMHLATSAALAQGHAGGAQQSTPSARPYQGLFGGSSPDPTRAQVLDLTLSAARAYDDNVLSNSDRPIDPRYQQSGTYTSAQAGLAYAKHGDRLSLSVTAGSGVRLLPSSDYTPVNYRVTAGLTASLGSRTTVQATQGIGYTPFYRLALLPGSSNLDFGGGSAPTLSVGDDYGLVTRDSRIYATAASITRQLSTRASVALQYSRNKTDFADGDRNLSSQTAGFRYTYQLNQNTGVHAGYGLRSGTYFRGGEDRRIASHDIDVGLDYHRALSLSRRTTFSFGTGSSVIVRDNIRRDAQRTAFRLLGNALLVREMGQSWSATANYERGAHFVEGFGDVFFSDSFAATLGGYLSRRVDLSNSAGYSTGSLGLSSSNGRAFGTYSASTKLRVALTQNIAVYTQYLYYHYKFHESVELPAGLPPGIDRQSARVGLDVWIPLLR